MAYIISVNASILSDSGGTCVCPPTSLDLCATDVDYGLCKNELRRDLITATAAAACLASFLMGLFANIPVGLAPGLGLNAYVSFYPFFRSFGKSVNSNVFFSSRTRLLDSMDLATQRSKRP